MVAGIASCLRHCRRTNRDAACHCRKGIDGIGCNCDRQAGHAARNEGDNAIYKVLDDIARFSDYRFENRPVLIGKNERYGHQCRHSAQCGLTKCTFVVDIRSNEFLLSIKDLFAEIKKHAFPK